jgi:chemotaxis protein MotB
MARARARAINANYWPGFVDALTTLLLVIIFLLVVFVLAQVVLSQAISGKDAALERLNQQVQELADLLDLERQANTELRLDVAQLSGSLQNTNKSRDQLELLLEQMTARAALLEERAGKAEQALVEAAAKIGANRETVELRVRQLESLRRDIAALRSLRAELEAEVAALGTAIEESGGRSDRLEKALDEARIVIVMESGKSEALAKELEADRARIAALEAREADFERTLEESRRRIVILSARSDSLEQELQVGRSELGTLRDRSKELEARLASDRERTLLAQKEIEARDIRLSELILRLAATEEEFDSERRLSEERRSQIALLNLQIIRLREDLSRLQSLLDLAEEKDLQSLATIKDLGRKLNRALARKVEELARYRSEFFGRLKEVLGERPDIEIVGDRFVFQSEVLFASASAELGEAGREQMRRLAQTLVEIGAEIPAEINWVLRVDGHTDSRPIHTAEFPSNWELSTSRAISVVRFLTENGVPPTRLAATGFAEFQPLDPRQDEIGFRRNRRIELKLTQR